MLKQSRIIFSSEKTALLLHLSKNDILKPNTLKIVMEILIDTDNFELDLQLRLNKIR